MEAETLGKDCGERPRAGIVVGALRNGSKS